MKASTKFTSRPFTTDQKYTYQSIVHVLHLKKKKDYLSISPVPKQRVNPPPPPSMFMSADPSYDHMDLFFTPHQEQCLKFCSFSDNCFILLHSINQCLRL